MKPDHDELRRLAEAGHLDDRGRSPETYKAWCLFKAECTPATILALLDDIDALERRVAELEAAERLLAMR